MQFYLDIIKFHFLEELAYPTERVMFVIRKLISLGFLILFWQVISNTNPEIFTFKKIVSYFLISEAVRDLTFFNNGKLGGTFQKRINNGALSNFLIKPIDILRYHFAEFVGKRATVLGYAIFTLTVGIIIFPPQHYINYLLFATSLVFTTIAGAGISVLLGIAGFYTPEARGIRHAFEHTDRILSGALIPLDYFPKVLRTFANNTPFPVLTYYPIKIIQEGGLTIETGRMLLMSAFWAVVLITVSNICWKKALRTYDGVGI